MDAASFSNPALRRHSAPLMLMLALAGPGGPTGHAQQNRDPFDVQRLRPATPSSFWEGPRGTCAAPLQVPDPLRLADAVDVALCNNPQTRQSWANAKVQAAQVGIARSDYLPSIDAAAVLQRAQTWNVPDSGGETNLNGALTFNYLLFDFGGRDAAMEQARESLLAADWTHNSTLQSVLLGAVPAYYQLYATQEAVDAVLAAEKARLNSLDATRARQRAGTATRADVLQAQTAYSQSVLNRRRRTVMPHRARRARQHARAICRAAVAIAPPPDLEARQVAERAVSRADRSGAPRRPDLAAAQAAVRAAQSNVKVQESAGKPTLSLFAGLGATALAPGLDPNTGSIGLQLRIPLFTGYQSTYQILQARDQLEFQQATRDRLATDVSLDVWRAYQDLQTQGQSLTTTEELVASAQESYNAALARYKAGVGTIIDLLNAQSALASAQLQRIEAHYRWNLAKVTLARAIGVLDPALIAGHTPPHPPQERYAMKGSRATWCSCWSSRPCSARPGAGWMWWQSRSKVPIGERYEFEDVGYGDVTQTVTANGTLNPVGLVNVGTQVSGTVKSLHADFNEHVKAGQVLLELDPTTLQATVEQTRGELASAEADAAPGQERRVAPARAVRAGVRVAAGNGQGGADARGERRHGCRPRARSWSATVANLGYSRHPLAGVRGRGLTRRWTSARRWRRASRRRPCSRSRTT